MTGQGGRLPGDLLRRAAERVFSRRTMESVVIPALADLQHEAVLAQTKHSARRVFVLARGYMSVWSALSAYGASWPARSLREHWLQPEAPGRRLVRVLIPRAALLGVVLSVAIEQSMFPWAHRMRDPWLSVLALPSVTTITVPIALFFALVLTVGRLATADNCSPKRWLPPVVAMSTAVALCTFVLFNWVTPPANQAFRERLFRWVTTHHQATDGRWIDIPHSATVASLPKGTRELTLEELRTEINKHHARGDATAAFAVEWHKKWAIPAACVLLGPLAIAFNASSRRPRPLLNCGAAVGTIFVLYVAMRLGEHAALTGFVDPFPAMWAGDAILALATLWLFGRSPRLVEDAV